MILIACGANLPSQYVTPAETIQAAYTALENQNIHILQKSRIWLTAPVPFDPDQDWYHNSVISVKTDLPAHDLLTIMLNIENEFGRIRSVKNAPRLLDLDLIAYNDEIMKDNERLIIPHPRMHERLFVLKPLEDIDKNWTHPKTGHDVPMMLNNCPPDQRGKPIESARDDD